MSEHKVCPFCGSHDVSAFKDFTGRICIRCRACDAYGPAKWNTRAAEKAWNERVTE